YRYSPPEGIRFVRQDKCECVNTKISGPGGSPMKLIQTIFAFAVVLGSSSMAMAQQSYPSRAVTIIVPFAAGGPTDVIARTMAQHMRTSLGQSVIVENVAGANGNIGVGRVA